MAHQINLYKQVANRKSLEFISLEKILEGTVYQIAQLREEWGIGEGTRSNELVFIGKYGKTATLKLEVKLKDYSTTVELVGLGWQETVSVFVITVGWANDEQFAVQLSPNYPEKDAYPSYYDRPRGEYRQGNLHIFEVAMQPRTKEVLWIWDHLAGRFEDLGIAYGRFTKTHYVKMGDMAPFLYQDELGVSSNPTELLSQAETKRWHEAQKQELWAKICSFVNPEVWIEKADKNSPKNFIGHAAFRHSDGKVYSVRESYSKKLYPFKGCDLSEAYKEEYRADSLISELYENGVLKAWTDALESEKEYPQMDTFAVYTDSLLSDIAEKAPKYQVQASKKIEVVVKGLKYSFENTSLSIGNFRLHDETGSHLFNALELGTEVLEGIYWEVSQEHYTVK